MPRESHTPGTMWPPRPAAAASLERTFSSRGEGLVDWGSMPDFKLVAPFEPTGDQPEAIERLADGLARGFRHQVLLGATGTGKTFTIARVIEKANRPTLVLAHNKTLAAQLYAEFRDFFPDNAVEYFVSYFDYYQPEAYLPRSDTYIEKDSSPQRGDRQAPPRGDEGPLRTARRDHRRLRQLHLRPRGARSTTGPPSCASSAAGPIDATRSCAISSTSSTSATTRPCSGRGSACAATPWSSCRRPRTS